VLHRQPGLRPRDDSDAVKRRGLGPRFQRSLNGGSLPSALGVGITNIVNSFVRTHRGELNAASGTRLSPAHFFVEKSGSFKASSTASIVAFAFKPDDRGAHA